MKNLIKAVKDVSITSKTPLLFWMLWVIWLPFHIPNMIELFQVRYSTVRLLVSLIGVTLFFSTYLIATWNNVQRLLSPSASLPNTPKRAWLVTTVLTVLSILLVVINGAGWLDLFIYTSAYAASRLPLVHATLTILTLLLLSVTLGWLRGSNHFDVSLVIALVLASGISVASLTRLMRTNRELRIAREEIARLAVRTERLRIARDLHDLLGHNLSLIALKSELAKRVVHTLPERATTEIADVERVARTTLQEVREAVSSYRQPTLASEFYGAEQILTAAGIGYHFEGNIGLANTLSPTVEAVLSWTVREGVTNVIRHSRARNCTIRIAYDEHTARVEIIDNGKNSSPDRGNKGNGLRGLAERVVALKGKCEAGPSNAGGFCLAVTVPLTYSQDTVPPDTSKGSTQQTSVTRLER